MRLQHFVHALLVAGGMDRGGNASSREQIFDLPDRDHRQAGVLEPIEQRRRERRQREVAAVRRPAECAWRADERPRDHASDPEAEPDHLERNLAPAIQLRDRHDVFVRGDLEHAVGRRVHDRLAGPHVLVAELLDDGRAARGLVGRGAAADSPLELVDDLARETRSGNTGNGRSSTRPISSQWPGTESLPGDASAIRPYAPSGSGSATVDG